MKNSINSLRQKMPHIYTVLIKSTRMLIFLAFAFMMSLITFKAGEYSRVEPSQLEIESKISDSSSKKLDQEALDKLNELQERNISIDSLFDNGRTNPFEN